MEEDLMISNGSDARPRGPRWQRGTLMSRLDSGIADELLRLARGTFHPAGAVLIRQGDAGTHVYLLQPAPHSRTACVKVTAASENGTETLLGIRASGDVVGELGVLGRRPRAATVTTCSTLTAHAIPAATFLAFLERRPQAWQAVSLMIADRLAWANRRRVDYAGHDVMVHIARVIVDLMDLYGCSSPDGGELGVSLSQPELGSLVGAGKDSAAKATKQLRDLGLIDTGYRKIIVLDDARLRSVAQIPPRRTAGGHAGTI
jgi:CRP/FNR family transcriptional regulator, cyclic AMP receptor protein